MVICMDMYGGHSHVHTCVCLSACLCDSPIKLSIARTLNQRQDLKLMLKSIQILMLYAGWWILEMELPLTLTMMKDQTTPTPNAA